MKDTFRTVIQIAFLVLSFIFITLLASGFNITIEKIKTFEFWLGIAASLITTMIFYNIIFNLDLSNRKSRKGTLYYKTIATKQIITKRIKDEDLYNSLDIAVEEENKQRYENECDRRLHKVCVRVSYIDLPKDNENLDVWFEDTQKKLMIDSKTITKLKKVVNKILNGKVRIKQLCADDLLRDNDSIREDKEKPIVFDSATLYKRNNIFKMLTFLVANILLAIISRNNALSFLDFLMNLLTNCMLLLGAMTSAISASIIFIKTKTQVYDRQIEFFAKRMNLKDEYIE